MRSRCAETEVVMTSYSAPHDLSNAVQATLLNMPRSTTFRR